LYFPFCFGYADNQQNAAGLAAAWLLVTLRIINALYNTVAAIFYAVQAFK
jgi:hypothetical protein